MKKLYAGNFSWNVTDDQLEEMFAAHGTVESCVVIKDRETGRSRGFGFIEMDDAGADAAIEALNGMEHEGRQLRVNEAQDRNSGGGSRGGGGGNRGGGNRW